MGMGYSANLEVVITTEDVLKFVPNEYQAMMDYLDEIDGNMDDLAYLISFDYWDLDASPEQEIEAQGLYLAFQKAFKDQTGVTINIQHHDSEVDGSRYDEVDGVFFTLQWGDVFEYTPEAKALMAKGVDIKTKSWVTYG